MTIIDLGDCEKLLTTFYSYNDTLYIKKLDIPQDGLKTTKIEYDVYRKLSSGNLEKLSVSVCEDSKISLFIPIEINEDLDKLNKSSDYFNDICYTSTTETGTDISLKDRKKDFIDNNKTICQEDCDFAEYNYTTSKAKCSCKVKESSSTFNEMTINKTKLYESLIDYKNVMNIGILGCFNNFFNKKGIIKNIGCYIIIIIIIFHIINIFIFFIKQLNQLEKQIKIITTRRKDLNSTKDINKIENNRKVKLNRIKENKGNKKNNNKIKNNLHPFKFKKKEKSKDKQNRNIKSLMIERNNENKNTRFNNNIIKANRKNKIKKRNNINELLTLNNNNKRSNKNSKVFNQTKSAKVKNNIKYIDEEINTLPYELAIKNDKRKYCECYISLLKTKHNFIFSFFNINDYNSQIIKIDLFFVGFTTYCTVNTLFFDDDTMHNIYENKGTFDIEYQITKIIYSSLISMVLNTPIKLLGISNNSVIEFKQDKDEKNVNKRAKYLIKILIIKFITYFILSLILLILFWYYVSMFGAIYRNTQISLLKDTLINFALSLFYPFGIYLLPGLFRISALSSPKKNKKCLYNFS